MVSSHLHFSTLFLVTAHQHDEGIVSKRSESVCRAAQSDVLSVSIAPTEYSGLRTTWIPNSTPGPTHAEMSLFQIKYFD